MFADPPENQRLKEACAFGEAIVAKLEPGTVLDDRPIAPPYTGSPDDDVVSAWRKRGPTNLFIACPALKSRLPTGVRFATSDDFAALTERPPKQDVFIAGFPAPFVSTDGQQLIHAQVWRCPGLCGGTFVQRMHKESRGWSKPETLGMSLS